MRAYKNLGKDSKNIVSALDAKAHLSRLLREVQEGQTFTITKRGKPVARLVPLPGDKEKMKKDELLKEFDLIREKVKGQAEGNVDIKSYIEEGRKY